jgi:hypothetical protein
MPAHALVTSRTPGTRNGNRRRAAIVAAALLGAALGGAYIGALEHHLIWALMSVAFLLAVLLAVTFPGRARRFRRDLDLRLARLRADIHSAIERQDGERLDALRRRPGELSLSEDDAASELEMIDGGLDLLELVRLTTVEGRPPVIETGHKAIGADRCHFVAPASLAAAHGEHTGKLFLTDQRVVFLGGATTTVPWSGIREIALQDRDLVMVRSGGELYRFRCNTWSDAMRAEYIARWLRRR